VEQDSGPSYVGRVGIGLDKFVLYEIEGVLSSVRNKVAIFSGLDHVLIPVLLYHCEQVGLVCLSTWY
jgi:hypothetical protein